MSSTSVMCKLTHKLDARIWIFARLVYDIYIYPTSALPVNAYVSMLAPLTTGNKSTMIKIVYLCVCLRSYAVPCHAIIRAHVQFIVFMAKTQISSKMLSLFAFRSGTIHIFKSSADRDRSRNVMHAVCALLPVSIPPMY